MSTLSKETLAAPRQLPGHGVLAIRVHEAARAMGLALGWVRGCPDRDPQWIPDQAPPRCDTWCRCQKLPRTPAFFVELVSRHRKPHLS